MTTDEQFWWNWWASVATSFVTFLAVLVALFFGPWISAHLFRPKLSLSIKDPRGELSNITVEGKKEPARFYYLRASSIRFWPKPTEAQVLILRIDELKANGKFQTIWTGKLPLRWTNQEIWPLARTIVQDIDADFFFVTKRGVLSFMPLIGLNNMKAEYCRATNLVVIVQAHSKERASKEVSVAIDWDGNWDDGTLEMVKHLSVRELPA